MFGAAARDIAATERAMKEDAADCQRRADEAEARLDAPLTRREVLDAIETVASVYSGQHGHDTRDLLRRLAKALS
jgi:hypothetical protein